MTTRLSPYGGLGERTERGQRAGLPQHVWVDGRHPGVILTWQRDGQGWHGYVVWVRDQAVTLDWLPAARLTKLG